jgi:type 1 glutamine amidotransferase
MIKSLRISLLAVLVAHNINFNSQRPQQCPHIFSQVMDKNEINVFINAKFTIFSLQIIVDITFLELPS